MNQMGHQVANLIGVDAGDLDTKVQSLLPKYMTMGVTGMGEMAEAEAMAAMPGMEDMAMPGPENTASMIWKTAPYGAIPMGGMTTVVKIRHEITDESAKSWYKHPPEEIAKKATKEDLEQDGIKIGAVDLNSGKEAHKH